MENVSTHFFQDSGYANALWPMNRSKNGNDTKWAGRLEGGHDVQGCSRDITSPEAVLRAEDSSSANGRPGCKCRTGEAPLPPRTLRKSLDENLGRSGTANSL